MATLQHYIGYDNVVTISNVSATSEAAGFPATNLANPATYPPWQSNSTASTQYVTVTANGAPVDYIGIAGHNLHLADVYVAVQYQAESGGAWVDTGSYFFVRDASPILLRLDQVEAHAVRLKIFSLSAAMQYAPKIAVMYAGAITQLPHNVYGGVSPVNLSRNVETVEGMSQNGQYLGSVTTRTTYSGSVALRNLSPSWYRSVFDPFVVAASGHSGEKVPFFYAWRHNDYPEEVAYCWLQRTPVPQNSGIKEYMEISMSFDAIA